MNDRRCRLAAAGSLPFQILLLPPLVLSVLGIGCMTPKRAETFVVPGRCVKVNVQSFTRPCMQRADGKLVCDGVVITADCVTVSQ